MVLYLDLIIFKEFIMDSILLIITKTVLKKNTNRKRIIISSLVGVTETVIDLFISMNTFIRLGNKIITSILMIKIMFKTKDIKEFAKEIFIFYLVSFIFAGITVSIMFSKPLNQFLNTGFMIGEYSNYYIIISIILGSILIIVSFRLVSSNIRKDNIICDIEICIENVIVKTKVLLDTGNLLCEPITGYPVVVIEKNIILKALDKKERKIYLIPYKTLGSEEKVLFGIKPEYIKVSRETEYTFKEVIIGLYDGNISNNNSYSGLVGIDMIEKGV